MQLVNLNLIWEEWPDTFILVFGMTIGFLQPSTQQRQGKFYLILTILIFGMLVCDISFVNCLVGCLEHFSPQL